MTLPLYAALLPVAVLFVLIISALFLFGTDFVAFNSWALLLTAALSGVAVTYIYNGKRANSGFCRGIIKSARQTLPAVPILLLIGSVAATWMLSGVVPVFIKYGLAFIDPALFLLTTCCACAAISVLTGSSWTTIATIGVAFMGIGGMFGYSEGWIAGAIISGAYFGDKMSPLSDTTTLAASSAYVDIFQHIRYMIITTLPSLIITLIVFFIAGQTITLNSAEVEHDIVMALEGIFNLDPLLLAIPVITLILIVCRVNTIITLAVSTLLGLGGILIFQGDILLKLAESSNGNLYSAASRLIFGSTSLATGNPALDELVATGGMLGMLPTVLLVISAMIFGGVMMGSGALERITEMLMKRLHNKISTVGATAASGLFLNSATSDQYLSIIIGGNLYRQLYNKLGMENRMLSRTIEDSVSVTSVLIPWNSCGVTHASVLGVSTLTYLPYCVFNYISPLMSCLIATIGFKLRSKLVAE